MCCLYLDRWMFGSVRRAVSGDLSSALSSPCVLSGGVSLCVLLLSSADCREILLPLMTDQLKSHLDKEEEPRACCQLLSDILEVLYRKDVVRDAPFLSRVVCFFISLWGANRSKEQGDRRLPR